MTQEEKDLLFKDLCARLPDDIFAHIIYNTGEPCYGKLTPQDMQWFIDSKIEIIKPYLRPLSSMTEEEKYEINEFLGYRKEINVLGDIHCAGWNGDVFVDIDKVYGYLDWLNCHHFDYRGLIKKGLAIEAPEGMYF